MTDRQPHAGEYEPDDIADEAQSTCPNIFSTRQIIAANSLLAERPEGELPDDETGFAPRNSNDRDKGQQTDQPGQQELRGPCRRRKIWRKETKQTTNNRIFEV